MNDAGKNEKPRLEAIHWKVESTEGHIIVSTTRNLALPLSIRS
jgi:hypothetical protein